MYTINKEQWLELKRGIRTELMGDKDFPLCNIFYFWTSLKVIYFQSKKVIVKNVACINLPTISPILDFLPQRSQTNCLCTSSTYSVTSHSLFHHFVSVKVFNYSLFTQNYFHCRNWHQRPETAKHSFLFGVNRITPLCSSSSLASLFYLSPLPSMN